MSTNSMIAVFNDYGDVRSVYCHWDGYLEWNGKMLVIHFDSLDKALALVDGGDISSLEEGGKVNYYKDNGDDWEDIKPTIDKNLEEMFSNLKYSTNIEFVYTYCNGIGWSYRDMITGASGMVTDGLKVAVSL